MNKASHVLRSWKAPRSVSAIRAAVNCRCVKILGKIRKLSLSSRILAAAAAIMLLVTGITALWGLTSRSSDTPAVGTLHAEITQLNLDYAQGTGSGNLEVYVPYSYVAQLVGIGGNPVTTVDNDSPLPAAVDIDPLYGNGKVQFSWRGSDGQQEYNDLSFQDFAQRSMTDSPVLAKSVDFQLLGSAGDYPSDQWRIALDLVIWLPGGVHIPVTVGGESDDEVIPLVSVRSYSGFNAHEEEGNATLTRPFSVQCLLYTITLAPLLLAFAAVVSRRRANPAPAEAPLELAAALISIFALRSVLVPGDLPGLTRIDYLLAVQTVAIISAVAFIVAFHPPSTPKP
jgi:hypothetical protein